MVGERCSVWAGISVGVGERGDYEEVRGFHYRGGMPAVVSRVLTARYGERGRVVGVIVESYPVLNCALRRVALAGRYDGLDKREAARRLNREMRVIARVVVMPQFRGIGLGGELVRRLLASAGTRYVEALAAMGRVHPLFEKAGMKAFGRGGVSPVYYLWTNAT